MPRPEDTEWNKPKPRTPAPRVDPVLLWPTPERRDLMFFVERNGDLPQNQNWKFGDPFEDRIRYPNHRLVYVSPQSADKWSRWYFASDRINQDDYNWEFTKCDFAGNEYNAIRRTYLIPRREFSETSPEMASANPDEPNELFGEGYILASRQQQRSGDETLDALYVIEVRLYVKRCSISATSLDQLNGKILASSYQIYHISESIGEQTVLDLVSAPTNEYWGVQSDGTSRTFKALSCEWYRFDTEQLVSGEIAGGVIDIGSYMASVNYEWPRVFSLLEFMDWDRRDGAVDIRPRVEFDPDGYNGPCHALISRSWSKNPQILIEPTQMLPTPVIYSAPLFSLQIPSCLHPAITAVCDTGNADPVYKQNVGSARTTPATNYTTWPDSVIASDDQEPYRGGYLRTLVTVYKPNSTPFSSSDDSFF
jgi:hypothetical protein